MSLKTKQFLGTVVKDQHQGTTHTAEDVGDKTLVQSLADTFLGSNLLQAIASALVDVLLNWLLSLHLQASSDSVKRIADTGTSCDCNLGCCECAQCTEDTSVILVRVQANNGVKGTKLESTVRDNT